MRRLAWSSLIWLSAVSPVGAEPAPQGIAPLARVVRVGDQAWSLDLVRNQAPLRSAICASPGQASALDSSTIAEGVDVGNVLVERRSGAGWEDAVYSVDFAFAFHAFYPEGEIHLE